MNIRNLRIEVRRLEEQGKETDLRSTNAAERLGMMWQLAAAHGLPRPTGVIDLWIRRSGENARRVAGGASDPLRLPAPILKPSPFS